MTEITDAARQYAADLANAEDYLHEFKADDFDVEPADDPLSVAFARLATRFLAITEAK